jgi:N,N'-diacetyllegionaminate synthase
MAMRTGKKVYIIAEIGVNHNGSLDNCYRLIDAAKEAGCDCVKFQFFTAKELYPRCSGKLDWTNATRKYSYDIYEAVKSFELPKEWVKKIIGYCRLRNIDFTSSIFDIKGVRFLIVNGIKAIKLPSYAVTNLPLIEKCARYKLPIFISTGGATLDEVKEAVGAINKYHNNVSILHCSIKYPTKLKECNLGVIKTLQRAFPHNTIGYSDHTKEASKAPVQAVYLGSKIIEKHITLDKKMKGPDHFFALEPCELKQMVRDIRKAEDDLRKGSIALNKEIYGSSSKVVYKHERYLRDFCFATIFAGKNIRKGARIKYKDLRILRPGKNKRGIDPKFAGLFKRHKILAAKDVKKETPIDWSDILNA